MSMTQEASEYFRQNAGSWDAMRSGYFGEAVRETAFAKAYLRPEMVVADVGSGTGFIAAGLAPLVRRVYVVDGAETMLEIARKNLSAFTNIEYHHADGLHLPFPDESLDAVFANMYLHHCPDPLTSIQEMVRVLRPGGRLVITDMDSHPYAWLKAEMADVWQGFERSQVRQWFQEAGLVNVILDCTGQSCCAESANPAIQEEQERQAKISVFVATGARRMSMRSTVQNAYASRALATDSPSACTCGEGSSCCSGTTYEEVTITNGYTTQEISAAPQEAAEISLGCGNPLAMASLQPGETVVDIGSGGGLDSFLAAAKVGPQGQVIGVDMTPEMLNRARATAEKNGIHNVAFRQGYAEHLPIEDATVDVVLSNCVINLTEDKGQIFREAFRVLKPGGRLEVSDIVTEKAMPIEMQENPTGWAECVTGALPRQEYLDLIAQAGFEKVTIRSSTNTGEAFGVTVYSAIVSAQKPVTTGDPQRPSCQCAA